MHGGLSLARYAEIGALLKLFPTSQRDDVLRGVGLDPPRWAAIKAAWSSAMSGQGDPSLLTRWSAAFEAALAKLRREMPSITALANAGAPHTSAPAPPGAPLATTLPVTESPVDPHAALPFAPSLPPPGARPPLSARRDPAEGFEPPALAMTVSYEGATSEREPVTLPFTRGAARPSPPRSLTLDQYASLCVELTAYPDRRGQVLARYAIRDEPTFAAIDLEWRNVLVRDPILLERWHAVCRQMQAWLRGR